MISMFLQADELRDLTARVQHASQAKVLRSMGIEHRARPDGSLAVLRSHVEQVLGGTASTPRKRTPTEPNWSAVNASRA